MVYWWFFLGLVVLVVGAEVLIRGAVALASTARISPLVIGLTIVAFGTSAPELAVSAISSLNGESAIALGNVVGSNIFNVLLILGLSAAIIPLTVTSQLVRLDVPLMVGVSVFTWLAALDGSIDHWEALLMLGSFAAYTLWLIRAGRREANATRAKDETTDAAANAIPPIHSLQLVGNGVLVLIGLVCLVIGARWFVASATEIARAFGVSDMIIGLTIVAAGTSLPELATSLLAAIKGERDIAIGNVVGSNVFNLLAVLATASLLSDEGILVASAVRWFDLLVMMWVAILCWPMFLSHGSLSRGEGWIMLLLYVAYTSLLIVDAKAINGSEPLRDLFAYGLLPLVLIGSIALALRARRSLNSLEQLSQK